MFERGENDFRSVARRLAVSPAKVSRRRHELIVAGDVVILRPLVLTHRCAVLPPQSGL